VTASRSTSRRIALLVLSAGVTLSVVALAAGAGHAPGVGRAASAATARPAPMQLPDTLAFEVEYAGVGAEGIDLIWRGQAGGPVPAQVTIRMEYAGGREDHAMPVWPVNVCLFYSADNYRSSFAAELSGSMNWRTGELRVSGLVTDGFRMNVPLEQRVQLHRPGLAGAVTLVFLPRVALSDALAAGF
jgi:hypothetical protein